jgi:DNA-binding response OmpR family regulator
VTTIAIVEDDNLLARMYAQKFEKDGYKAIIANDGQEGLDIIREQKPDLVLLDIMLPKINGFKVLEKIKEDSSKQIKNIPVVLLTNLARGKQDIDRGLERGAVCYLIKWETTPTQVVEKIKEILKAKGHDQLLENSSGQNQSS